MPISNIRIPHPPTCCMCEDPTENPKISIYVPDIKERVRLCSKKCVDIFFDYVSEKKECR